MFVTTMTGLVTDITPHDQTRFQCDLTLNVPLEHLRQFEPGTLLAVENVYFTAKEKRYTILQVISSFPTSEENGKKGKGKTDIINLSIVAIPIGMQLIDNGPKKEPTIEMEDTFPTQEAKAYVLDDDTTMRVIHQIAPESHSKENGSRVDIGAYAMSPNVTVGLDSVTLLRGNIAVISARPRARTTITNNLITSLLTSNAGPLHVVYCDVNNQGTMSLLNLLAGAEPSSILCLNDKFVPSSVFGSLRSPGDRQAQKRAVLDFMDMMILPSVLEQRRHDFSYGVGNLFRSGKISIYRANEQTVDQFINDIRIDILDGVEEDVETYMVELMDGIADTYKGERFGEKNTRDILEMIDEFSQDSKNHGARRTLYDLKAEIQSIFESYSKDIPAASRKTISDIVNQLNDETKSSLLVVQGQKTTDILRFIGSLTQTLIEERLRRLKLRVPVLFMKRTGTRSFKRRNRSSMSVWVRLPMNRRISVVFCPWTTRRLDFVSSLSWLTMSEIVFREAAGMSFEYDSNMDWISAFKSYNVRRAPWFFES